MAQKGKSIIFFCVCVCCCFGLDDRMFGGSKKNKKSKSSETDDKGGKVLSLAFRGLKAVPMEVADPSTVSLDLSHNKLSKLQSLKPLTNLRSLVLDNNRLNTHIQFPYLPHLERLWLNNNKIDNLELFIDKVCALLHSNLLERNRTELLHQIATFLFYHTLQHTHTPYSLSHTLSFFVCGSLQHSFQR